MVHRLSPWCTLVEAGQPWQRRVAAWGLMLGVIIVHGCVADHVSKAMLDLAMHDDMPKRMDVVFVREMEVKEPVLNTAVIKRAQPARTERERAPRQAHAASVPDPLRALAPVEPQPLDSIPVEPSASDPQVDGSAPRPTEGPASAATTAAAAAASAAPAPAPTGAARATAFAWPASTRLSYVLTGNYRGDIHGTAQVEWVRSGNHYQVHMDVTVGLSFLPLMSRRMTSDGQLTPEGLVPRSYDEDSKVAGRDRWRSTIRFEPDGIFLPNGRRRERWSGVQDAASQFVQMTYLFTIKPELLTPGNTVEIPLALPRNVDWWLYDVLGHETLHTPFGALDAVHLKPRRVARKGGDLTSEIWFAPSLAFLPARIRIQQDDNTYIDLMIKRKPQLAAE